jgi:serine/threonine-protein kinase
VRAVLDGADDNEWRRAYRKALSVKDKSKLRALAGDPKALAQPPVVICNLVDALSRAYSTAEGLKLLREAQRLQPGDFWINYLLGLLLLKTEPEEAVGFARAAVALRPSSGQAHALLGKAFLTMDDTDNAIRAFHGAITRDPDPPLVGVELATILSEKGRRAEIPAVWEAILTVNPQAHKAWFGYAEICLFLGKQDKYHQGCEALLERFGETTDPLVAERVSRACLLAPDSDDQLRRAAALADRAAALGPEWLRPYYLFAQGLAAYRQNRPQDAIRLLEQSAKWIPYPTARLVLSMSQFRCGLREEARKGLQAAIRGYTWKDRNADWVDSWVAHVLRFEAEALILTAEKPSLQK